jgi:hypothetical protein
MRRKVAAALAAVLVLGLASCGGSQRTETVSRAQVVSRLEAACVAGAREGKRHWQARDGRVAYVEAIVVEMKTIMDQVEHLETTGRAKADFDAYKATLRTRIAAAERITSADAADVPQAVRAAEPAISAGSLRGHAAIVRLGARHICI